MTGQPTARSEAEDFFEEDDENLEEVRRLYYQAHKDDSGEWGDALPVTQRDVLVQVWNCVCGRRHAPWWRTTPPPGCTRRTKSNRKDVTPT